MKNIAFINLTDINEYCRASLDQTVASMILNYCRNLPDTDLIIPVALNYDQINLFYENEKPEKELLLEENSIRELIKLLSEAAEGADHCYYLYGDTPLLDRELTGKMYENHCRYFADYTFADGYPYGLTPEILSVEILPQLKKLAETETGPVTRDALFRCIQKDINAFDIETEISPVDMRLMRLSLSSDSGRNWSQLAAIWKEGGRDARSILDMAGSIQKHTRTIPAYFQVQLTERCRQTCSYCPYPDLNPAHRSGGREMSLQQIRTLAEEICRIAPDGRLSLSLWGDPSTHSDISGVLRTVLESTTLKILIETSGLGWEHLLEEEEDLIRSDRIEWIFSLDALSPDIYRGLRGEGQSEAVSAAERFLQLNPDHTWIQAVRMNENEEDLEQFYRHWKENTENVIVQKYDHFCGSLPGRKVTDLSPLNRFPCWHLKREMVILVDGTVPLCREDLKCGTVLGNVFNDSLEEIWEKGYGVFQSHTESCYTGICENCDEYYTYNF